MPKSNIHRLLPLLLVPPMVLVMPYCQAQGLTLFESEFTKDGTIDLSKFDRQLKGRSQRQIQKLFAKPDLVAVSGINCSQLRNDSEYWFYDTGKGNVVYITFYKNKCVSARVTNPGEARDIQSAVISATAKACKGKTLEQIASLLGRAYTLEPVSQSKSTDKGAPQVYSFNCGNILLVLQFKGGHCASIDQLIEFH